MALTEQMKKVFPEAVETEDKVYSSIEEYAQDLADQMEAEREAAREAKMTDSKFHYEIDGVRVTHTQYLREMQKRHHERTKGMSPMQIKDSPLPPVNERLLECARLFESRNAEYGNGFLDSGVSLFGMFGPMTIRSAEDWTRMLNLINIVAKLRRYMLNFRKGGHEGSLDDISVYAQMLAAIDADIKKHSAEF